MGKIDAEEEEKREGNDGKEEAEEEEKRGEGDGKGGKGKSGMESGTAAMIIS